MVYFVGAGSGDPELITVKGQNLLRVADVVVWAESLVNPALLNECKEECAVHSSARMTLDEICRIMIEADRAGKLCVRLHTGDPCLYGAIKEQMDVLDAERVRYEIVPGVSSLCGAAAALKKEYTVPELSQSVIITRMEGRTPVPQAEKIASLASHGCTMVVFLSVAMIDDLVQELLAGGVYTEDTPVAVVYKATWPRQERIVRGTLRTIAERTHSQGIENTALIIVGSVLKDGVTARSRLYDMGFFTSYRAPPADAKLAAFEERAYCCFTERGYRTAVYLAALLGEGRAARICRCFGAEKESLQEFVAAAFDSAHAGKRAALIFIGAAGIAMRACAPHIRHKAEDPAVVCMDEARNFVIPLLSGHIGGANALARVIAEKTGAQAALTTATDSSGVFAVDTWAVGHAMRVLNAAAIKNVSAALLAGRSVAAAGMDLLSPDIRRELPESVVPCNAEKPAEAALAFCLSEPACFPDDTLVLVPRLLALGIGCRRHAEASSVRAAVEQVLGSYGIERASIRGIFSTDLKKDEAGIISLARELGVPFVTFSPEQLKRAPGRFEESDFVASRIGIGNVCGRSAVFGAMQFLKEESARARSQARVVQIIPKTIAHGVSVAAAMLVYKT